MKPAITETLLLSFAILFGVASGLANGAHADQAFRKKHPHRAQVLRRDKRLHGKTEKAEKNGKITQAQGKQLEKEEGAIKNQEQAEAAANGGHITKTEQRQLNREENRVRRQLKRDERKDAAGSPPAVTPPAATPPAGSN